MEMKHTPGPWRLAVEDSHVRSIASIYGCSSGAWLEVWTANMIRDEEEQEANARLISAAPDLLAACIAAKKLLEESAEQCTDAMEERECPICEAVEMCRLAIAKATSP